MLWNNLSIAKKLAVGFGTVCALLITISTITYSGFTGISDEIERNLFLNEIAGEVVQKEIDHLKWQNKVMAFLHDKNVTNMSVSTDHRKCKLGQWLYGEKRSLVEKVNPSLGSILKSIEAPHKAIHDSAKEIQEKVNASGGSKETAMLVYKTKTKPSLIRTSQLLEEVGEMVNQIAMEGDKQLQADTLFEIRLLKILTVLALAIAFLFSFIISKQISSSLQKAVGFAGILANGDLSKRIELKQKDEVGLLVGALDKTAEKLNRMIGSLSSEILGLDSTSNELNGVAGSMSGNSRNVSERSSSIAAATEQLSVNMNSVAAASEEASTNVNIVATASEEVTSSIEEVDAKTREARSVTEDAVRLANSSSRKVDSLGEAANQISKVTEVITEISDQTNLLALNATIEAARAGEAGKGFAVVANEIKELAKQTAEATGEIRSSIESMQGSTAETVAEIKQISEVIEKVDDIVAGISNSVAEQTATTNEISSNIQQAAIGISEVNENVAQSSAASVEIAQDIAEMSSLAGELSNTGNTVSSSAGDLADIVNNLNNMVSKFIIDTETVEQRGRS